MKLFRALSKSDDLSCLYDSSTVNINNTWILLPIYHLTLMSFCTKGLPGVAESTASKSEMKPSPWREGARKGDWGVMKKGFSPNLTQRLRKSPLSLRSRVILDDGFCDFAYGSAQNDKVGGTGRVKVFISKKPTKNESGALCIGPWIKF